MPARQPASGSEHSLAPHVDPPGSLSLSENARSFFRTLYPTDVGHLDLRALPSRAQAFPTVLDVAAVDVFVREHHAENVYVGVSTRRTAENGTLVNCAELWALFVDLDFKDLPEAEARVRLDTFPLPPSLLVNTGGGLHPYWLLREPYTLPGDAAAAKGLLRRLARHLDGDLASAEPARVLRVPDSLNVKYDPPRRVVLEHADPNRRYNASEFDDWLAPEVPTNGSGGPPFAVPTRIHDGVRNTTLYRSARSLHAKGFSAAAISAALTAENAEKCDPPLSVAEVKRIAAHAATQPDREDFAPAPEDLPATPTEPLSFAEPCPIFLARFDDQDRPDELVVGLIPGIGTAMIHGQPRTMKSIASLEIAIACATATPAFGLLAIPRAIPTWHVTEEDPPIEVRDRLRALLAGRGISAPDRLHVSVQTSILLDDPAWQQLVLDYARTHWIALTIIDPLRASTMAVDQGPRELKPFAAFLRRFSRETGSVLLLTHHDTKPSRDGADSRSRPQRASGGGIFSIVDAPIHAERVDDEQTLFTPTGYKFSASPAPFVLRLQADAPDQPAWMRLVGDASAASDAVHVALHDRILAQLREHPGLSGNKLAASMQRNRNDVFAALETLRRAGQADYYTRGQAHMWFVPGQEAKP